ncbi:hypothetical protein HAX54_005051, partial [Datura stramonium]|nr:hypothetical protein [Datura stramonium]
MDCHWSHQVLALFSSRVMERMTDHRACNGTSQQPSPKTRFLSPMVDTTDRKACNGPSP